MGDIKSALEQRAQEMSERALQQRIAYFINKWQPDDKRMAAEFSADVNMLVRAVYGDMQKPVTDMMARVISFASNTLNINKGN